MAAVYSNRLRQSMMLQADPTIIYPITRGKPLGRRIKQSEIADVNDYNTYAMTGLPSGPIANPGPRSIEAVLHPAKSDALYFVANGKGGHVFARTLAEHNANVAQMVRDPASSAARCSGSGLGGPIMSDPAHTPAPIIVTALMGPQDFAWANGLRKRHFPSERNQLDAHVTLFHHLPPASGREVGQVLARLTADYPPPRARLNEVMHLGRGVAYRIDSPT